MEQTKKGVNNGLAVFLAVVSCVLWVSLLYLDLRRNLLFNDAGGKTMVITCYYCEVEAEDTGAIKLPEGWTWEHVPEEDAPVYVCPVCGPGPVTKEQICAYLTARGYDPNKGDKIYREFQDKLKKIKESLLCCPQFIPEGEEDK